MKKKLVLVLLSLVLVLVGISGTKATVNASGTPSAMEDIAYEDLLNGEYLVGESQMQTRGYYLVAGQSVINKQATNKIGAGGITNASTYCKVSVTVIVERLEGSNWVVVANWTASKANDSSVMSSKILTVATGYSYRVRCLHYAASDASSSWTSALSM